MLRANQSLHSRHDRQEKQGTHQSLASWKSRAYDYRTPSLWNPITPQPPYSGDRVLWAPQIPPSREPWRDSHLFLCFERTGPLHTKNWAHSGQALVPQFTRVWSCDQAVSRPMIPCAITLLPAISSFSHRHWEVNNYDCFSVSPLRTREHGA